MASELPSVLRSRAGWLRAHANVAKSVRKDVSPDIIQSTADEIEEAAARIEELEALLGRANDMLDSGASVSRGERVDLMDEIEAALAAKETPNA